MLNSQIHKRINFNFSKQKLVFDTSQELFSFAKVDDGTKELLNSLRKNLNLDYKKVLDLGCGYGVIGIFIKNEFKDSNVLCTDRDSLAVEFAKHNAELNSVEIESIPSLDFEQVPGKFSLILTNFPAKLEATGLEYFIAKSFEFLEKDGTLALVVVKELNNSMEKILKNENIKVVLKEKGKNHSVYHLKFSGKLAAVKNPYRLNEKFFTFPKTDINLLISECMQEFDTPHFVTRLIINKITNDKYDKYKKITIVNPGQGLVPVAVVCQCSRDKITLASRDLLQLRVSGDNLKQKAINYFENINTDFSQDSGDLLVWGLRDETHKEVLEKLEVYRKSFKKIILGGRIHIINRVLQNSKIESVKEIIEKYCVVEI